MQDFGEQVQSDMHFADGSTGATMHNRLPVLFHRATRAVVDAYERTHPGRRIFFFTRAGYSGTPGTAAYEGGNFPGDETTDWTAPPASPPRRPTCSTAPSVARTASRPTSAASSMSAPTRARRPGAVRALGAVGGAVALLPAPRLGAAGAHTPWSYGRPRPRPLQRARAPAPAGGAADPGPVEGGAPHGDPPTRPLWLAYPSDGRAAARTRSGCSAPTCSSRPSSCAARAAAPSTSRADAGAAGDRRAPPGPAVASVPAPLARLPYYVRCGTRPLG